MLGSKHTRRLNNENCQFEKDMGGGVRNDVLKKSNDKVLENIKISKNIIDCILYR